MAADASAIYVRGHERWMNNKGACNSAGPGSASWPRITGLSAGTGMALVWNPTRDRGHGALDQLRTSAGLWVASDTYVGSKLCAGGYHPGICSLTNG